MNNDLLDLERRMLELHARMHKELGQHIKRHGSTTWVWEENAARFYERALSELNAREQPK